ncbi:MAG: ATP synthase subunit I [Roseovarius sp.]
MTEGFGPAILSLLTGGAFGLLYLGVLWGAVRVLASGQSVWLFAAMGLLRAGLLVGVLWLAVRTGATAAHIAFALLGFIAIRVFATRMAKAARPENLPWK